MITVPTPRPRPDVVDDLVFAGAVVRQALRESGTDIQHAALRMGISRRTLYHVINGEHPSRPSTLRRVEHFLRWRPGTIDWIRRRDVARIRSERVLELMDVVEHRPAS